MASKATSNPSTTHDIMSRFQTLSVDDSGMVGDEDFLFLSDLDDDDVCDMTLMDIKDIKMEVESNDEVMEGEPAQESDSEPESEADDGGYWTQTWNSIVSALNGSSSYGKIEEVLAALESIYLEERSSVVRSDGFIATPLHALKYMTFKYKEPIHKEISFILEGSKRLVRVEIFAGAFRGVGEAFEQRLASQMAALDWLVKLQLASSVKVAPFCIYPGWRIQTRVCRQLLNVCLKNGLKDPQYVTKSNIRHSDRPVYNVQCKIGGQVAGVGESDIPFVARKMAAQEALELITGATHPLEYVALGQDCLNYNDLLFGGRKSVVSDMKRSWLLETSLEGLTDRQRGIDEGEKEMLMHVVEEEKRKVRKFGKFEVDVKREVDEINPSF